MKGRKRYVKPGKLAKAKAEYEMARQQQEGLVLEAKAIMEREHARAAQAKAKGEVYMSRLTDEEHQLLAVAANRAIVQMGVVRADPVAMAELRKKHEADKQAAASKAMTERVRGSLRSDKPQETSP